MLLFNNIIWDFDGTLFDTYPVIVKAFKLALNDEGIQELDSKVLSLVKISIQTAIDYYKAEYNISNEFKERYDRYRRNEDIEMVRPFVNTQNVCRLIKEAGKYNYLYTHRGESSFIYLKHYNMYGYFRDFITKESNFKRKPDPEALQYLIGAHKMRKEEALMIGDREIDLFAAKNAGIKACLFDPESELKSTSADFVVNDMEQLLEII